MSYVVHWFIIPIISSIFLIYISIQITKAESRSMETDAKDIYDHETWLLIRALLYSTPILLVVQLKISLVLFLFTGGIDILTVVTCAALEREVLMRLESTVKKIIILIFKVGCIYIFLNLLMLFYTMTAEWPRGK